MDINQLISGDNDLDVQKLLASERHSLTKTLKKINKLSPNSNPKWKLNMLKHYEKELVELIMRQAGVDDLPPEYKVNLVRASMPKHYTPVNTFTNPNTKRG